MNYKGHVVAKYPLLSNNVPWELGTACTEASFISVNRQSPCLLLFSSAVRNRLICFIFCAPSPTAHDTAITADESKSHSWSLLTLPLWKCDLLLFVSFVMHRELFGILVGLYFSLHMTGVFQPAYTLSLQPGWCLNHVSGMGQYYLSNVNSCH